MVDEGTLAVLGLGGAGSIVAKPTLVYLGERLREGVEAADSSLSRRTRSLFERMQRRHDENGNPDGTVPERVAQAIIDEGLATDDVLVHEYLATLAANSIGQEPNLDLAISDVQMLKSLSTPALHFHYQYYLHLWESLRGDTEVNLGIEDRADKIRRLCSWSTIADMAALPNASEPMLNRVIRGLDRLTLLNTPLVGSSQFLRRHAGLADKDFGPGGFIISPTLYGAQFWADCLGHQGTPNIFGTVDVKIPQDIPRSELQPLDVADLPILPQTSPEASSASPNEA